MRAIWVTIPLIIMVSSPFNSILPSFQMERNINSKTPVDGEWERVFGGSTMMEAYYVDVTSDGGYALTGWLYDRGSDSRDLWVMKTDGYGRKIWYKIFGASGGVSDGYCVHETSDGGFVVVGSTTLRDYDGGFWLIKLDANGNKVWDKVFGGPECDVGWSGQQTSDGGFILVGQTDSFGSTDVWLVKTDSEGNMLWSKTFGGKGMDMDIGYSVEQTSDGGYIITGNTDIGSGGLWLIKTDDNGNMVWNKIFGGKGINYGYCVHETSDGGYIVTGVFDRFGWGDIWLIKTDSQGNMVWNKIFGGGSWDVAHCVQETSDGGFIIVGFTTSYSRYGGRDLWIIKTDRYGNKVWGRILGGSDNDEGYCIREIEDGYIVAGSKNVDYYYDWCCAWLLKVIPDNKPPGKPILNGPTSGKINRRYTINFTSIDPEGDNIYYFVVVWGLGISGWIGPYKSGETVSYSFIPTVEGSFNITVKAMDEHGWEGIWSDPLHVTFPKPYWLNLLPPFIQKMLFGFKLGCL